MPNRVRGAGQCQRHRCGVGLDMPNHGSWPARVRETYAKRFVEALKDAGPDLAGGGVEVKKWDAPVTSPASRPTGTRCLPEPLR